MNWVYLIPAVCVAGLFVLAPVQVALAVAFVIAAGLGALKLTDWLQRHRRR